jgi:hypothetical protein
MTELCHAAAPQWQLCGSRQYVEKYGYPIEGHSHGHNIYIHLRVTVVLVYTPDALRWFMYK